MKSGKPPVVIAATTSATTHRAAHSALITLLIGTRTTVHNNEFQSERGFGRRLTQSAEHGAKRPAELAVGKQDGVGGMNVHRKRDNHPEHLEGGGIS